MTLREFGDSLCGDMTENSEVRIVMTKSAKIYGVDSAKDSFPDAYIERLDGTGRQYIEIEQERAIYRAQVLGVSAANGKMYIYVNA